MTRFFTLTLTAAILLIGNSATASNKLPNSFSTKNAPDSSEVYELLNTYIDGESTKDQEKLQSVFLTPRAVANFVMMGYGSPNIIELDVNTLTSSIAGWNYHFYPVYSGYDLYFGNGMVTSSHNYQGYADSVADIHGRDLFLMVQTPDGLKTLNITSNITEPEDETIYDQLNLVNEEPMETINQFIEAFNSDNQTDFNNTLFKKDIIAPRFQDQFSEDYHHASHSAKALFDTLALGIDGVSIEFDLIEINTYEQVIASVNANYTLRKNGEAAETGEVLINMAASPSSGWKITAMAFSAHDVHMVLHAAPQQPSKIIESKATNTIIYYQQHSKLLTVENNSDALPNTLVKVYNLNGKTMYSTNISEEEMTIPLELNSGLYLVVLTQHGKVLTQQKIIVKH